MAGALAYNALIDACGMTREPPFLAASLENHCIEEKYRAVWISKTSGAIVNRDPVLFDWRHRCRYNAEKSYPESPDIILTLESICSCCIDIPPGYPVPTQPCDCVINQEPADTFVYSGGEMVAELPSLQ